MILSSPRVLVLDRDGTLIEHVPYLADPAQVRLMPGVRDGLEKARQAGARLFIHSNQSGVGRGYFNLEAVQACNHRMIELLDLGPAPFDDICIAPEAPDKPSLYRKPSPRFAQELLARLGVPPTSVCYIGDRGSDLETAHRAGVRGVGVATGLDDLRAEIAELGLSAHYPVFDSFAAAIDALYPPSASVVSSL